MDKLPFITDLNTMFSPQSCYRLARKFTLEECDGIRNWINLHKIGGKASWNVNYSPFGYKILMEIPGFTIADIINLFIKRGHKINVRFNKEFVGLDLDPSFKYPNIVDTWINAFYKAAILNLPDVHNHTFRGFADGDPDNKHYEEKEL